MMPASAQAERNVDQSRDEQLVSVEDLSVSFRAEGRRINAVNGIDLSLKRGEVLTILGESGSGKSVTLRALMRLLPEKRTTITGRVSVGVRDVLSMPIRELRRFRGGTAAMIFQEPSLAFDPVYTVGYQIAEMVMRHDGLDKDAAMARALDLFDRVRIPSAKRRLQAYPHEMSGGMRQRAMIALALSCHPDLLLADEPTTALDASVQIQILLLLRELQAEMGMRQGVDGYLIACFDDTGLDAARTCAQGPVMGLCEAGIKAATIVATGFSIVTTLPRSVPVIRRLVANYGADRQCLSVRASGVPVLALEEKDGGDAVAAIRRHAIAARDEDGAECVVLGCAGMAALADDLTETLGIPVIDPVRIGTALLEGLIRSGIRTSKTGGYAAPGQPLRTHPLPGGTPSGRP